MIREQSERTQYWDFAHRCRYRSDSVGLAGHLESSSDLSSPELGSSGMDYFGLGNSESDSWVVVLGWPPKESSYHNQSRLSYEKMCGSYADHWIDS